jgi:hypothetical protein
MRRGSAGATSLLGVALVAVCMGRLRAQIHPFLQHSSGPPRPATLYVEGVPMDASEREVRRQRLPPNAPLPLLDHPVSRTAVACARPD